MFYFKTFEIKVFIHIFVDEKSEKVNLLSGIQHQQRAWELSDRLYPNIKWPEIGKFVIQHTSRVTKSIKFVDQNLAHFFDA